LHVALPREQGLGNKHIGMQLALSNYFKFGLPNLLKIDWISITVPPKGWRQCKCKGNPCLTFYHGYTALNILGSSS